MIDMSRLERIATRFEAGHDAVQIKHFIIGIGVTPYGRFRQACLEVSVRVDNVKTLRLTHKRLMATIGVLNAERMQYAQGKTQVDEARALEKSVEIEEKRYALDNVERELLRTERELLMFADEAERLEREVEWGKGQDALVLEYHVERLKRMAVLNTVFHGGNLSGVAEAMMMLPGVEHDELQGTVEELMLVARANDLRMLEAAKHEYLEE